MGYNGDIMQSYAENKHEDELARAMGFENRFYFRAKQQEEEWKDRNATRKAQEAQVEQSIAQIEQAKQDSNNAAANNFLDNLFKFKAAQDDSNIKQRDAKVKENTTIAEALRKGNEHEHKQQLEKQKYLDTERHANYKDMLTAKQFENKMFNDNQLMQQTLHERQTQERDNHVEKLQTLGLKNKEFELKKQQAKQNSSPANNDKPNHLGAK